MKQQHLINLIEHPQAVSLADLDDLGAFTKAFPFFQTAQLLYTIGVKDHLPQHYQKQLRKTAIIANNRTVLYELLHPAAKPVEQPAKPSDEPARQKPEQQEEKQLPVSNVTVTNDEVKVIYISTTSGKQDAKPETPENKGQQELDVLKGIDNDTAHVQEGQDEKAPFDEQKLNKDIELEISRQLVDAYVQTEVIRTPELHDMPARENREEAEKRLQPVPGSFMDWLQKVKQGENTGAQKTTGTPAKEEKEQKNDQKPAEITKFEEKKKLIDKIIESDPGKIRMSKDKFFSATQDAKQSLLENEHLITETLAKIYALQGNVSKAIRAYEILSLKFPQKSAYFASLIEKLKTK